MSQYTDVILFKFIVLTVKYGLLHNRLTTTFKGSVRKEKSVDISIF